ncbi:Protein of unknown function [Pyronema omphalodes CBS 100304]|uniref:Uncharacterized protein n=1 Tax=Pyronema omphalodes (strain CBS 100304) TaxID=1076935 RepID=U4L7L3_PYROM|nr:Protein of unknown function [Pyronema omphalodes CBS 100304]
MPCEDWEQAEDFIWKKFQKQESDITRRRLDKENKEATRNNITQPHKRRQQWNSKSAATPIGDCAQNESSPSDVAVIAATILVVQMEAAVVSSLTTASAIPKIMETEYSVSDAGEIPLFPPFNEQEQSDDEAMATDISDSTTHSHYQNQNIDLASGVAEVFTWAVNPVSLGPPSYA